MAADCAEEIYIIMDGIFFIRIECGHGSQLCLKNSVMNHIAKVLEPDMKLVLVMTNTRY